MFEKWIDDHREEIIAKTQGVLRIHSVRTPKTSPEMPFGQGCADALDYVLNLGREMGFTVKNVDGYAGHIEYGEGDDYYAVLAHLDVVPEGTGWTHPPYEAEIHDGKIYARGAIDDKGPGMAALFALQAVKESGVQLNKKIRLIYGLDEESDWECMDHYFKKEPMPLGGFTPDAVFPLIFAEKGLMTFDLDKKRELVKEGAAVTVRHFSAGQRVNMVPDGCRVVIDVNDNNVQEIEQKLVAEAEAINILADVEVEGRTVVMNVQGISAHASTPDAGVNAIVQAARLLTVLDDADKDLWEFIAENDTAGERLGIGLTCGVTGPLTLNLGIASVDMEHVKLTYNARFPVERTIEELHEMIREKVGKEGFKVDHSVLGGNLKPLYVPKESEVVQTLLRVYREETGDQSEPLTIGGATYARAIPNAVAFGALFPGQEELAHQKDENWRVDDLIRCTKIYAKAIHELAK